MTGQKLQGTVCLNVNKQLKANVLSL